jgi:glycosyltransferase involved in cell wall biosynthesis
VTTLEDQAREAARVASEDPAASGASSTDGAPANRPRLDYLCLQPLREGQASYAHVHEIIAGLERRGWDVRLVRAPDPAGGRRGAVLRAISAFAVQVRYALRTRFRPASVVYIRSHFLALPTAALARAAGSVVVQEVNGVGGDAYAAWPALRRLRSFIRLSTGLQLAWADAIITVTEGLADRLATRVTPRAGCHVIGNGADVDRFRPDAGIFDHPRPYVVFVGALAPWQGIETVLDAVRSSSWPAGVDLVIAGDGKERDRVRQAAESDPRIRWLGTVPYRDVPSVTAASAAALVPMGDAARSRFGLSPLKLFEAMACGVPVVASDFPTLADTVREHDCGVTFPASQPHELAQAVARVVADPAAAKAMGARGRAACVERYSWDARAAQTQRVIRTALRARGRAVPSTLRP